jgi:ACS family hexuronate transporter-like MFS transporter
MRRFFTHRYRWLIVGILFFFSVASNFDRQTLSILAPTLKEKLGFGSVEYSYVVTSFLVAYTIGYIFAGRMLDRFGVKLCLGVALGFWSLTSMAHAAATGWVMLVVLRFLLGLGESFNSPGGIKALSEWVPNGERGLCIAIFNNGYVWGAILAAPIVAFITLHFNWHLGFIMPGLLSFVLLVLWWKMYDDPERHPRLSAKERAHILTNRDGANGDKPEKIPLRKLVFHPICMVFFIARFLTDPFSYFFNFWLPDYFVHSRGFSLALLGLIGWLPYLAGDIGGPGGGALSDWLVRRGVAPLRARFMLLSVAAILMPLANVAVRTETTWLAVAIIAVMFAGQTCWMANQLALLSEYFPRSAVATVISISAIGGSLGGIVATLLTGQAVQHYGYVPVFTVMSGLHLIALTAIGFVLFRRQGLGSYVTAGT